MQIDDIYRLIWWKRTSGRKAFTLIELLTVMVIITVLMGLIIGIVPYAQRAQSEAKVRAEIEMIHNALQEHKMERGFFPNALMGGGSTVTNWMPAGFDFTDSWDEAYLYTKTGPNSYKLHSKGRDKIDNTADDISSGK